jgi:hypothetical protein
VGSDTLSLGLHIQVEDHVDAVGEQELLLDFKVIYDIIVDIHF